MTPTAAKAPQPKRQNKRPQHRRNQATILASAELTGNDTFLIEKDIFNEPTRERLAMQGEVWVRFFEQNDTFLKGLIACVNNSPTLRRIIEDKTNMVVGDGYMPYLGNPTSLLASAQKPEPVSNDAQLAEIEETINRVNLHDQTLADVNKQIAADFDGFGNAMVEVVTGRVGSESFVYLYHVPLYNVAIRRAGVDQIVKSYGIYDDWENVSVSQEPDDYLRSKGFREIAAYPNFTDFEDGTKRSIIHIKQYSPGYFYWGQPEWIGARMWAEIEYRIQRYNVSKFDNSFLPSGLLQMFGSTTPEEARKMVDGITKKYTGTGNNHKLLVQVIRDEKLKANWQPMSDEKDGEFLALQNLAASAIVVANRWSKSLAGFATSGQLGTNQQIRQEMEYLQNTVVKPRQNLMLTRIINPYLYELAKAGNRAFINVNFGISNSLPVSFMGDIDVEANLTQDEKRELLGYSPLENDQTDIDDGTTDTTA